MAGERGEENEETNLTRDAYRTGAIAREGAAFTYLKRNIKEEGWKKVREEKGGCPNWGGRLQHLAEHGGNSNVPEQSGRADTSPAWLQQCRKIAKTFGQSILENQD